MCTSNFCSSASLYWYVFYLWDFIWSHVRMVSSSPLVISGSVLFFSLMLSNSWLIYLISGVVPIAILAFCFQFSDSILNRFIILLTISFFGTYGKFHYSSIINSISSLPQILFCCVESIPAVVRLVPPDLMFCTLFGWFIRISFWAMLARYLHK